MSLRDNASSFSCRSNAFLYQRFFTKPRFESEAQDSSGMAYCSHSCISVNVLAIFIAFFLVLVYVFVAFCFRPGTWQTFQSL